MLWKIPRLGEISSYHERRYGDRLYPLLSDIARLGYDSAADMVKEGGYKAIAVTSEREAEGKSLFSVNLAAALAAGGNKTLLLEADLRCPAIRKILGLDSGVGLIEILSLDVEYSADMIKSSGLGFDVLDGGDRIHQSPELFFESSVFKDLLSHLKGSYDFVIIDTPPMKSLSEKGDLLSLTDGVIFSLREGYSSFTEVWNLALDLKRGGVNVLGGVING